mgnify:CR=1 FL=1
MLKLSKCLLITTGIFVLNLFCWILIDLVIAPNGIPLELRVPIIKTCIVVSIIFSPYGYAFFEIFKKEKDIKD